MSPLASFSILCFGSLFSIVDPFAAVPIFLALAGGESQASQSRTALRASVTCFVVLTAFALAGRLIFSFYGFTIGAFKIAGGILLFSVALDMVHAQPSDKRTTNEERAEAEAREDVGLMPLGLPLLSGPGAIATVMVLGGKAKDLGQKVGIHVAVFAVSFLTFLILRSSVWVSKLLGRTGINIVVRIMGLILAAVAMQFIVDGALETMPGLGHIPR
jgi:multiple antibiotic resistance protein